jgi:heme/copper-type cytochrome/quinol oxidase subunit 2
VEGLAPEQLLSNRDLFMWFFKNDEEETERLNFQQMEAKAKKITWTVFTVLISVILGYAVYKVYL